MDTLSPAEMISAGILNMFGGFVLSQVGNRITINFPDMHSATTWAATGELAYAVKLTTRGKDTISFKEPVTVMFNMAG